MSKQKPLSKKEIERIKQMAKRLKTAPKEIRDGSFIINTKSTGGMSSALKKALREKLKIK